MKEGENVYEAYAIDAVGNKSESIQVKVFYVPPAPVSEPEPEPETETPVELETTTTDGATTELSN